MHAAACESLEIGLDSRPAAGIVPPLVGEDQGPAIMTGSREAILASIRAANGTAHRAAGATPAGTPKDSGFMYQRGFADLDGHHWEALCLEQPTS